MANQSSNNSSGGKRQNFQAQQAGEAWRPADFSNKMKVFFPTDMRIIAVIVAFIILFLLLFIKLF